MDSPQLMIAPASPDCRLSAEEARSIREKLVQVKTGGQDVIFGFPINIWQLVDGRWEALPTNTQSEVPDGTQVIRP